MPFIDYSDLPSVLTDFLRYLDVIKNKSPLTVQEYATDLRTFLRFLKQSRGLVSAATDFDEINISDIDIAFLRAVSLSDAYAFLSYCKNERHNNATTRSRKVSSIRGFFKYLTVQRKILDENPMQELDTPKQKKALPKYLTLDQSISLLEHIDGKNKERDYCMVTFFLNCGMRLSELVGLNLSDIHDNEIIHVTGKGDKERIVPILPPVREKILHYLDEIDRQGICISKEKALFLNQQGKRISRSTVYRTVQSQLRQGGVQGKKSPHVLRHTFATELLNNGADMRAIQELLGHASLQATQVYTHNSIAKLQKIYSKAHPREKNGAEQTKQQN